MSTGAKKSTKPIFAVSTILLVILGLALLTGCRDSEPPPEPATDNAPIDRSGERRRQAHAVSEGGPDRTGQESEAPYQGPADGDVDAAGYGEGYVRPTHESEDDGEAEDDEGEEKLLEP